MDPLTEIAWPHTPFPLDKSTLVLVARRGSEAHGLYTPSTNPNSVDDRDIFALAVPPTKYFIGLSQWEHTEAINGVWDVVVYSFPKFMRLLLKQNPNVVTSLWLEKEDYLYLHPVMEAIIKNRDKFVGKRCFYDAVKGYVYAQLKGMTKGVFKGYMGDKRKKLVEKFGYDTKAAAHAIRLLRMCTEFLETGFMQVKRTNDREVLLGIKHGKWTFGQVEREGILWLNKMAVAYKNSSLPDHVNFDTANFWTERVVAEMIATSLTIQATKDQYGVENSQHS